MLGLAGPALGAEDALPALTIDPDSISVVGVSSGAHMATQLAVAFPERFHGLGVFSGGPWGCARGALSRALGQCMKTRLGMPDLEALAERHAAYRQYEMVGADEDRADQRVFIWQGEKDAVVDPDLAELLAEQYRRWLDDDDRLRLETHPDAAHGWPIRMSQASQEEDVGLVECSENGRPFLLDCGVDGAGEVLSWLYPDLAAPEVKHVEETPGRLITFDQSPFDGGRSFDDQGYLFAPEACQEGAECRLVLALHGCEMGQGRIGEAFVRHSGLNEWAAANDMVVLYPQAKPSLPNPLGCWDWWGYAESTWQPDPLHDTREGRQARALMTMVEQVAGLAPAIEPPRD